MFWSTEQLPVLLANRVRTAVRYGGSGTQLAGWPSRPGRYGMKAGIAAKLLLKVAGAVAYLNNQDCQYQIHPCGQGMEQGPRWHAWPFATWKQKRLIVGF